MKRRGRKKRLRIWSNNHVVETPRTPSSIWRLLGLAAALAASSPHLDAQANVLVPKALRSPLSGPATIVMTPGAASDRAASTLPDAAGLALPAEAKLADATDAFLDGIGFDSLRPQAIDPFATAPESGSVFVVPIINASGLRLASGLVPEGSASGVRRPGIAYAARPGLRALLAQYVNILPGRGRAPDESASSNRKSDDGAPSPGTPSDAAMGDPIAEKVSEVVGDWLSHIFQPTVAVEGLVSFSIAGFGNFAIVANEEGRRIGVMDLDSGKVLTVSIGPRPLAVRREGAVAVIDTRASSERNRRRGRPTQLSDVIGAIASFLYEFVTSPLKVSLLLLLFIIWGVWRASASRV